MISHIERKQVVRVQYLAITIEGRKYCKQNTTTTESSIGQEQKQNMRTENSIRIKRDKHGLLQDLMQRIGSLSHQHITQI